MNGVVAVTGASGFVGGRLAAILLGRGFKVRAIHRRREAPVALRRLEAEGAELVRADLSDAAEARAALEGAASVIHAAALASDWGTRREFEEANVRATVCVLDAAEGCGLSQLVFVSSVSVHGFGRHAASTEEGPYYALRDAYPASKLKAERLALGRNRPGFSVASLRLGYVYGPGDTTSSYRMFEAARRGAFGWIGSGKSRTSLVYVDDACAALVAALGNPAVAGEAINIVGDEAVSWRELASVVYETSGADGHPRHVPKALAALAAATMTGFARLAGSHDAPPLTPYRVRRSTVEYVFSNEKARRILGFRPSIGYREGFSRAALAWGAEAARDAR